MTVTITITDPTATEATALRAYLTALHAGTAVSIPEHIRTQDISLPGDLPSFTMTVQAEPPAPSLDDTTEQTRNAMSESQAVTAEDAGAPDFDSAGMPWDERIHASSRATVADGTWRKKRGVSDELVAEVEAELASLCVDEGCDHHGTAHECVKHAADTPEVPEAPVGESIPAPTPDAPSPEPIAPAPASVPTPADDTPPPPPAPTANPFLAVMSRIGKSKLDKAKKDELLTAAGALDEKGAPSILVLNKRPELIDGFIALLDSEGV